MVTVNGTVCRVLLRNTLTTTVCEYKILRHDFTLRAYRGIDVLT